MHIFVPLKTIGKDYVKTDEIIRCISSHISYKRELRDDSFMIAIVDMKDEDGNEYCIFSKESPKKSIMLFPSRYRRKQSDKEDMIEHVLLNHYPDLILGRDEENRLKVGGNLYPGLYIFSRDPGEKRRKWTYMPLQRKVEIG